MTRAEFKQAMDLITDYFPKFEAAKESHSMQTWFNVFSSYPYKDMEKVINEYAKTEKYAPNVADITERLKMIPQKMVSGKCPQCGGSGMILVQKKTEETRRIYGDIAIDYAETCPTCKGWVYKTRSEVANG